MKVPTPKEGMVTTPFIHNTWVPKPGTTRVTPSLPHVLPHLVCNKRATFQAELKLLEKHAFIATANTPAILMVEVDKMAGVLEAMKEIKLAATVAFLRAMPPVDGSSSSKQVDPLFPDNTPTCSISPEDLEGAFSISSIAPNLCKPATKWGKQLAALEKWKSNPPLNSHDMVNKVGETCLGCHL